MEWISKPETPSVRGFISRIVQAFTGPKRNDPAMADRFWTFVEAVCKHSQSASSQPAARPMDNNWIGTRVHMVKNPIFHTFKVFGLIAVFLVCCRSEQVQHPSDGGKINGHLLAEGRV